MRWPVLALAAIGALTLGAKAQTPIDMQPVKELKPTDTLATCAYKPISDEAPFYSRLSEPEKTNGSAFGGNYTMHGKTGTYVAGSGSCAASRRRRRAEEK